MINQKNYWSLAVLSVAALLLTTAACGDGTSTGESTQTTLAVVGGESNAATTEPTSDNAVLTVPEGEIRIAHVNPAITLDLHLAQQAQNQLIYLDPLYDSLLRRLPNGELVGGLATDWEYNGDRNELTLKLRSGVTFHDGTQFDAAAVKANIERGQRLTGAMTIPLNVIETVEIVDSTTVRFILSNQSPSLLVDLASVAGMMGSPSAFEADDEGFATKPVGSGPWMYNSDQSVPGSQQVYDAYDGYWNPEVQGVARIIAFEMPDASARRSSLLSGQLDITVVANPDVDPVKAAGFEIFASPTSVGGWLLTDRDGVLFPELADVRVRQAINYAIDRQAIVDAVMFGLGQPNSQIFPEWMEGWNKEADIYSFDPDRARQLLDEAGYQSVNFAVNTLGILLSIDEVVQAMLADVGINVELIVAAPGTLGALNRSAEAAVANGAFGSYHPWETLASTATPNASLNPHGTTDPEITAILERIPTASTEESTKLYEQMSLLLTERAWFLPFHTRVTAFGVSPDVVGFEPPSGVPSVVVRGVTVDR